MLRLNVSLALSCTAVKVSLTVLLVHLKASNVLMSSPTSTLTPFANTATASISNLLSCASVNASFAVNCAEPATPPAPVAVNKALSPACCADTTASVKSNHLLVVKAEIVGLYV